MMGSNVGPEISFVLKKAHKPSIMEVAAKDNFRKLI
jgi:hypothetical protein